MTYKGASDSGDWIHRTGSHSTRPLRNGRIDDLPANVRQPEEYFNSLQQRSTILKEQLHGLQTQIAAINNQLRQTLPFTEFKRLELQKQKLAGHFREIQVELEGHKELRRTAALNAYGIVWRYVCEQMLSKETCDKIKEEVFQILGRVDDSGIHAGPTPGEKRDKAVRENQKERRRNFRNKRRDIGPNGVLVWSDELGGKLK